MNTENNMLDIPAANAALNDNGLTPLPKAPAPQSSTEDALAKALKEIESLKNQVNNQQPTSNEVVVSYPEVSDQYGPMIRIGIEGSRRKGQFLMFGHKKARWIVNHIDEIKAFADKHNA